MIKSMWINLEIMKPLGSANDPVLGRFGKTTTMDLKTKPDQEPRTNLVR